MKWKKNIHTYYYFSVLRFSFRTYSVWDEKKNIHAPPSLTPQKEIKINIFWCVFCLKNVFSSKPSQTKSVFYVYSRCHEINLLPQMNIIIDIVFIWPLILHNLRKKSSQNSNKVRTLHSLLLYYSVLYSVGADRSGPIMIRLLEKFFWPPSRKIVWTVQNDGDGWWLWMWWPLLRSSAISYMAK